MIRVVVVDDHEVVREGIRARLAAHEDVVLVGEAADAEAGLRLITEQQPDVAVLDISMPGDRNGIDVVRAVKTAGLATKLLIYSSYVRGPLVFAALDAGAHGFQSKAESLEQVVRGCRAVVQSEGWWFSREVQEIINAKHLQPRSDHLTPKEREVLKWVSLGYENLNVAARLSISENTVKNHLKSIYRKLRVAGRVGAALWAWRQGLVQDALSETAPLV
ncbi:response regulator [Acanthopleuribacter pedis]|uniref:Response regulator transcription factor n=1 Tax=Acanthopleuribacter pedis TaxID=442870 RepID=A0A8J7U4E8_9BACT|nr:response regulator transcription factor [Acanthopleuribacter pedis]MBO1321408.1 response regulator transcription factor [Acanthopleuribacter pedis]